MALVKTSELTGAVLDWAVAECEGKNPNTEYTKPCEYGLFPSWREGDGFGPLIQNYSTDWAQGGPIIEREGIDCRKVGPSEWEPRTLWCGLKRHNDVILNMQGPTPLIAAMRCYVASKLGDEVDVPGELMA